MAGYAGQGNNRYGAPVKSSLLSVIAMPIILIGVALAIFIYNLIPLVGVLSNGGAITCTEEAFNDYVDDTYAEGIKGASAKYSALVIVCFYNEDTGSMDYNIKAGKNLMNEVSDLFGSGKSFSKLFSDSKTVRTKDYKKTFAQDLGQVMETMVEKVNELELNNVFIRKHAADATFADSKLIVNEKTSYDIENKDQLTAALATFTAETGIPVIVSVDSLEKIAGGRTIPWTDILLVVAILALTAYLVYSLIKKIRNFKKVQADMAAQPQLKVNVRSPYYDDEEDEEPAEDEDSEYEEEETEEEADEAEAEEAPKDEK